MFCSYDEKPLILRIYGQGSSILPHHELWHDSIQRFDPLPGTRQIIQVRVESVQTSCGYAVPTYTYTGERDTLERWAEKKGLRGIIFERFIPMGSGRNIANEVLDAEEWKRAVNMIAACSAGNYKSDDLVSYRAFWIYTGGGRAGRLKGALCNLGDGSMALMPDGSVYP